MAPAVLLEPLQSLHLPTELQESLEPLEPPEPLTEPLDPLTEPLESLELPADQESLDKTPPPATKENQTSEDQESAEAGTTTKPKNTDFLKSIFDYL